MPFTLITKPQYRDADETGLIGIRGFMHYCQDIHTWFMHEYEKGNDVIPEKYGAGWIYTRYHIHLEEKADYTDSLELTAWMEPYRQPVLVNVDVQIRQHDRIIGTGMLETCVFSLARQRPLRLSAIEFPEGITEEIEGPICDFDSIPKTNEGMTERYTRTVRYSDLDKNRHMNNLRYIEMFEDAYDSRFWEEKSPRDMEICFMSQILEGEKISVQSKEENGKVYLAAVHEDGRLASVCMFR